MNYQIKLLWILCALAIGCTKSNPQNTITKVSFARSEMPFMAVEINSSLNYKYFGGARADKKGYFTGNISEADWTNFNSLLDSLDYKHVDKGFNDLVIDEAGVELIIQSQNDKRHYFGSVDKRDSLYKAYEWLIGSIQKVDLTKANDTLQFETRYQYPPTPKINEVKFPPPSN